MAAVTLLSALCPPLPPPPKRMYPLPVVSNSSIRQFPSFSETECIGIEIPVDVRAYVLEAMRKARERYDAGEGDSEGMEVTSTPPPSRRPAIKVDVDATARQLAQMKSAFAGHAPPALGNRDKSRRKHKGKGRRTVGKLVKPPPSLPIPVPFKPTINSYKKSSSLGVSSTELDLESLRGGRWVAPRLSTTTAPRTYTLEELLGRMKFELIEWDGIVPHTLLDKQKRICAVLAGRPSLDDTWSSVVSEAAAHMAACRTAGQGNQAFSHTESSHRRGQFFNLPVGISYGGGQRLPGNLVLSEKKQAIADELLADRNIIRVAGFQSNCFSFFFPMIYQEYWRNIGPLYRRLPRLQANFPNVSIFPACTFNLGPTTATRDHTDAANVAYGVCAITALGDFDPTLGGHLILFDLGLVIEFPPGSTVLIPSGLFRHGNTPIIGENATRCSFTQYCAGGIFRWVQYGFQTAASLVSSFATASEGRAEKARIDGDLAVRTTKALSMFSTIESLPGDQEKAYNLTARRYPK